MNEPSNIEQPGKASILVLACGALAREILEIFRLNGFDHIELKCLPADLHLQPQRIPDAVEAAVRKCRSDYEEIFVAYADCGTGGLLKARCDDLGVAMIEGPHCYSFFEGNEVFAARGDEEMTAFYLTDFLVRQFDAFVWQPMGLHRHPELRDMIFGNYTKLVYLAQTNDDELSRKAATCAQRLGLEYERRQTGYGDLEKVLTKVSRSGSFAG
ncbi:DUF1638 domain-containing protein [Amaricoccus tamworthensis]|uniref:DUF1638 domain-containing protein n=1 Tax=Amaricoccus tamworthensis TaxID=57002 RepID=UPI003C7ED19A